MKREQEPWNVAVYMDYVCNMGPWDFEKLCAQALQYRGWDWAGATPGSGDHGVDIIAQRGHARWAIQCKRYDLRHKVGEEVVKSLWRGAHIWGCTHAAILTTSFFTPQAQYIAPSYGVELWDRYQLYYLLYAALRVQGTGGSLL